MPINSFEDYPMSWKPDLLKTKQPIYLTLATQLEKDIAEGVLLPGLRLPPQRELADFLDINVSTVSRAFKVCGRKGLLSGTVGSGTFVAYDAVTNLFLLSAVNNTHLIEMGVATPNSTSHLEVSLLLKKMIAEPGFEKLFQYGSPDGMPWQKEVAVKLIQKAGYETTADKLLPASGGQNSITAIMAGLFQAGDRIGVDPMTYSGIKTTAKMLGIQLVPIRQENNEMNEEGLVYACKNEKIKGIYIMPDYHNPTTHMMSEKCRKMIARVATDYGLIIMEDGIHSLLNEHPIKAVAGYAPEQTIYIASLSKTIDPGLRLAYIVVPNQYKTKLADALYNINLSLSPFLLELASRMIASREAESLIVIHRESAKERNKLVNQYLSEYTVLGEDECTFRWLLLPDGITGTQFEMLAYEKGVQVYASERFAVGTVKPVAAVRLSIGATKSIKELEKGLIILRNLLQKLYCTQL